MILCKTNWIYLLVVEDRNAFYLKKKSRSRKSPGEIGLGPQDMEDVRGGGRKLFISMLHDVHHYTAQELLLY